MVSSVQQNFKVNMDFFSNNIKKDTVCKEIGKPFSRCIKYGVTLPNNVLTKKNKKIVRRYFRRSARLVKKVFESQSIFRLCHYDFELKESLDVIHKTWSAHAKVKLTLIRLE